MSLVDGVDNRNKAMLMEEADLRVRPLLTIAVPTYNRAPYLRELMVTLFDQLVSETRVELIVSDNASTDETPDVVAEFQSRGLELKYLRNTTNIGPEGNILRCFEEATGKYVWIFGDDDVLVAGAIDKILGYLQTGEYELVYVNSFSFEGTAQLRADTCHTEPIVILDVKIFVRRVHVFFTFISGNIVNKDRVLASQPKTFSILVGTSLVHLGWIYTALNGYSRGLYFEEKLVGMRINNTGGYKLFQAFGPNLKTITENWLQQESLKRSILNGTLRNFWPGMVMNYKTSFAKFEEESPCEVLNSAFAYNYRYWLFVYPILKAPTAVARWWLFFVRILNYADRAITCRFMN